MEESVKLDRWGYEVRTSSHHCISAINSYYYQELSYGRERSVILEAVAHDKDCVLANILASHFLYSSASSKALPLLHAAKSHLEHATLYEKLVFDAISYLISVDRDDDVAVELHSKASYANNYFNVSIWNVTITDSSKSNNLASSLE
ncbi:uncharacterized protein LOC133317677 [Gastrolobium bilobum]|uniref:uncharacterized protein LOC133317677 n=1 Tax=Gastrolobium bilobum TaxID=150636 RepID=UPI002AB132BD|nr:uncharacterized protein LOC133317677 [Gastrolobium bilobum]